MNYTRPNDENHKDDPKDWLLGLLMYTKVLGFLIPVGQGVTIDMVGDMIKLRPELKKVIVHNTGATIAVIGANERTDLNDGDWVTIVNEKDIMN